MLKPESINPGEYPTDGERYILEAFERPIPIMDLARLRKEGYTKLPIRTDHPLFNEPVANILDYGIAGQSYYSRPNNNSGEALHVDPNVYLRESVAVELQGINEFLKQSIVAKFFGGEVELFIQDGLRPLSLQKQVYEIFYPERIRRQYPGISEQELAERLKGLASKPSDDPSSPSPHMTGVVFDVTLRYLQPEKRIVNIEYVWVEMGHIPGDVRKTVYPDRYEQYKPENEKQLLGQRNRRAFYAIMSGTAMGRQTGFINLPTEFWHWGRGDQLSAKVSGMPYAVVSLAEPPTHWNDE